jgi:hypothetical protein
MIFFYKMAIMYKREVVIPLNQELKTYTCYV